MNRRGLLGAIVACLLMGLSLWLIITHPDIAKLLLFIVLFIVIFVIVGFMGYSIVTPAKRPKRHRW